MLTTSRTNCFAGALVGSEVASVPASGNEVSSRAAAGPKEIILALARWKSMSIHPSTWHCVGTPLQSRSRNATKTIQTIAYFIVNATVLCSSAIKFSLIMFILSDPSSARGGRRDLACRPVIPCVCRRTAAPKPAATPSGAASFPLQARASSRKIRASEHRPGL